MCVLALLFAGYALAQAASVAEGRWPPARVASTHGQEDTTVFLQFTSFGYHIHSTQHWSRCSPEDHSPANYSSEPEAAESHLLCAAGLARHQDASSGAPGIQLCELLFRYLAYLWLSLSEYPCLWSARGCSCDGGSWCDAQPPTPSRKLPHYVVQDLSRYLTSESVILMICVFCKYPALG